MRNAETGVEYCVEDGFLKEALTQKTSLDAVRVKYDLSCLKAVALNDSFESVVNRNNAEHSKRMVTNAAFGAILGGVAGVALGVLPMLVGIFLGTALGVLFTSSKKQDKVSVFLEFCDGHTLALEVGEKEYAVMASYIHKEPSGSVSRFEEPLTHDEKKQGLVGA